MTVNISTGKKYFTQRDNTIRAHQTCCPTSIAMALTYSGIQLPAYEGQLEDTLTKIANENPEVIEFYKNNSEKWIRDAYVAGTPANEVHPVMAFAVNKWIGREVATFTWATDIYSIFRSIINGKACVLSGEFEYQNSAGEKKKIGHIVCAVGFETEQEDISADKIELKKMSHIIIDDPYGNYHTLYLDHNGNDVKMPYADFMAMIKSVGKTTKWCYFFK